MEKKELAKIASKNAHLFPDRIGEYSIYKLLELKCYIDTPIEILKNVKSTFKVGLGNIYLVNDIIEYLYKN